MIEQHVFGLEKGLAQPGTRLLLARESHVIWIAQIAFKNMRMRMRLQFFGVLQGCATCRTCQQRPVAFRVRIFCSAHARRKSVAVAAVEAPTKISTVKIGTRGSPLAMAQAYLTKKLLQVRACDSTSGFQIEHLAKTRGLL